MLYVFGHQNPDTDTYCSAVACAAFYTATDRPATPVVLGAPNRETAFIFNQYNYPLPAIVDTLPAGTEVILVDHNEAGQSIAERSSLSIVAVYDHHKVADFETPGPVTMRFDTVGCTCTILREEFQQAGRTPGPTIAALMCAAIISDTLLYRSPTTTDRDRQALTALAAIAQIDDVEAWAMEMFDAKSDLSGMDPDAIITMDYKQVDFGGKAVGIGVIETTNPSFALNQKEALLTAMRDRKEQEGLEYILVYVVDILQELNSALVLSAEEETLIAGAFSAHTTENIADLGARVSRKKQILPAIAHWIEKHV